jgi:hypothetical protein
MAIAMKDMIWKKAGKGTGLIKPRKSETIPIMKPTNIQT